MGLSDQVSQRLRKYNCSRDDAQNQLRKLKASHGCLRFFRRRIDRFTDKAHLLSAVTRLASGSFEPQGVGVMTIINVICIIGKHSKNAQANRLNLPRVRLAAWLFGARSCFSPSAVRVGLPTPPHRRGWPAEPTATHCQRTGMQRWAVHGWGQFGLSTAGFLGAAG